MFLLGKTYEPCKSCELLKLQMATIIEDKNAQIESGNLERERMLETILNFAKPISYEQPQNAVPIAPIKPAALPWRIRKNMKEREDKAAFETLQRIKNETQKLEVETGIADEINDRVVGDE